MVSQVPSGRTVLERMAIYRRLSGVGFVRTSYHGKFALAAFVGIFIPLAIFVVYLLVSRADWERMYPVIAAMVLAAFMGFLGMLWILRELLGPSTSPPRRCATTSSGASSPTCRRIFPTTPAS